MRLYYGSKQPDVPALSHKPYGSAITTLPADLFKRKQNEKKEGQYLKKGQKQRKKNDNEFPGSHLNSDVV